MDWVAPFFGQASRWWGPREVGPHDHERADSLERLCEGKPKRILELGAGGGTTAAVLADRGHDVTAVELSTVRAGWLRERAASHPDRLRAVEGDFYDVDLDGRFACVAYWNGFGVGDDADQRGLLRRVADQWLEPAGVFLLTVFAPWRWARIAGAERRLPPRPGRDFAVINRNDYDPVRSRFFDTWYPEGQPDRAITQEARCYAPADLQLLLEGTSLGVTHAEVGGQPFEIDAAANSAHALWDAWEYLVRLERTGTAEEH